MAAQEHSSTRRRVLGAVAALPVLILTGLPSPVTARTPADPGRTRQSSTAREAWDRRLARYLRLHDRWKAEAETGAFRAANDEFAGARAGLVARFGSWEKARKSRIGKPLCRVAFARVSEAEDAFYDRFTAPLNRAIIQLVHTPVPDLPALLAKIEVIQKHEPDAEDGLRRPPIELLREDVRRLRND